MDAALRALAEPTRRRILAIVRDREATVGTIATEFDVSRPAISQHLRVLHDAGLVDVRNDGVRRYYRARPEGLVGLRQWLDEFWTASLHPQDRGRTRAVAQPAPGFLQANQPRKEEMTTARTSEDAITIEQRIAAPPETVFDFLVDPVKLLRWMGTRAEIDPRPGGRFWLNVSGADIAEGEYVEVARPHRIAFTWGWVGSTDVPPGSSTVAFDLRADGDYTIVTLTHAGLPRGRDDQHLEGWRYFVPRLVIVAEGGDPGPIEASSDATDPTEQDQS